MREMTFLFSAARWIASLDGRKAAAELIWPSVTRASILSRYPVDRSKIPHLKSGPAIERDATCLLPQELLIEISKPHLTP